VSDEMLVSDYRNCAKGEFYIKVEPTKSPYDDRRGDLVSIFKRGNLYDKIVTSRLCYHGDGGDELKDLMWDMYNKMEKYIEFNV